jgi:hypothetical protein
MTAKKMNFRAKEKDLTRGKIRRKLKNTSIFLMMK